MALHLVTGGAGYLGHQLALSLFGKGEKVRIVDVLPPPPSPAGIDVIEGDVRDRSLMDRAVRGVEVFHHNAALVPVTKAGQEFWSVHVEGTRTCLEAARAAGVQYFIYVSTSAVFGLPDRFPITEETPLRPIEDYGRSKAQGETVVLNSAREGFACAIVRPRTIIGPGRLGIFKVLFEWIAEGRRIYVIGDGNHPHQFVHCDDVVDFLVRLGDRRISGAFNIGCERFATLRADLEGLIQHARTKARVVGIPPGLAIPLLRLLDRLHLSPLGPWHYRTYHRPFYFDVSRALRELDWHPRYSNLEAFIQAYEWYLLHRSDPEGPSSYSAHRKPVKDGILKVLKQLS